MTHPILNKNSQEVREKHRSLLDLLFFIGFALLICHELDAVAQAEWRLLPGLASLSEEVAFVLFVSLHAPLSALLMWGAASPFARRRRRVHVCLDVFFVVHVVLHLLLANHEHYTFHSVLSRICIFGAGAVGLLHLALVMAERFTDSR